MRVIASVSWAALLVALAVPAGCGGSKGGQKAGGTPGDDAAVTEGGSEEAAPDDGPSPADGGGSEGGSEGDGAGGSADGPPSYTASCTPLSQQTGTIINTSHGRLDGYLSFVVPQSGPSSCNGDDSHVHLQIRADGHVYDVAVDIGKFQGDALLYEADMPMPQGAWAEGWHDVGLSYPQLGLHSTQFTTSLTPQGLGQKIQQELANANHVSVFGDGYDTDTGCHDVHYENGTEDGALVIDPLSPTAHILFFRFSTPSF
jgi:hypothetical protein